ncbi:alpha/beta hydrolase [Mycobacterium sp. Y57]|uniref:alpha/beta hydrolase n=1 Tax=Mycolicibacterium xanthum TaxID=2796469 RepID=UPI001C862889|nr:alpha/beta hydrolase [Mycolicibacterium xanthum]MBX7434906.1 alpha/beta hydrolase [Mycolicibacterium xanthum]
MDAPVVLVHGTNAGPWTMANFGRFFADLGWRCLSPPYRHHDDAVSGDGADLLAGVGIADYVDDIAAVVSTLDTSPVIVGHSLGGVIAQKLAARGQARAIVLLNGSVNWGILPTTDAERALAKALMSAGPFWETTLLPDFDTMSTYGLNMLGPAGQRRVFDRLGPESGRVMFELFFWMFDENQTTRIDYRNVTCPVLMVSGSEDLAIPPSTSRAIAQRHGSLATFHEADGFGHYLTLEPNWRQIAELCARWMADTVE